MRIPPTVEQLITACQQLDRMRLNCELRGGSWPTLEERYLLGEQFEREARELREAYERSAREVLELCAAIRSSLKERAR